MTLKVTDNQYSQLS